MTPDRTAAAIEARRAAEQKLGQVRDAIAWLRRGKMPVTYPAVGSGLPHVPLRKSRRPDADGGRRHSACSPAAT
jgi:hypothetical protein